MIPITVTVSQTFEFVVMYAKPIFLPTQRLEDLEDRRFVWHVHACYIGDGRLLRASFSNADPDRFPPFYVKRSVF